MSQQSVRPGLRISADLAPFHSVHHRHDQTLTINKNLDLTLEIDNSYFRHAVHQERNSPNNCGNVLNGFILNKGQVARSR